MITNYLLYVRYCAQHWEYWNLVKNIIHSRISQFREKIDSFIQVIQSSQQNDRALNVMRHRQAALWEMVGSEERQVSWESIKPSRCLPEKEENNIPRWKDKNKNTEATNERKSVENLWAVLYYWSVRWKEGKSVLTSFEADVVSKNWPKRTWNLPSKW